MDVFRCFFCIKIHVAFFYTFGDSPGHTSHATSKCNADLESYLKYDIFVSISMYFDKLFSQVTTLIIYEASLKNVFKAN